MQTTEGIAEQSPCYVDDETGLPIIIAGLPYKDLILLLTAINESVLQSAQATNKLDPFSMPLPATLPALPSIEMSHWPTPNLPPPMTTATPAFLSLVKQAPISWAYVAKRSSLPEGVCRTVWSRLQESIGLHTNTSNASTQDHSLIRMHQPGFSALGGPSVLESYKHSLLSSGRTKISVSTVSPTKGVQPKPAVPEILQKKRFSEAEDRLLLMALLFHDGNYELIQSKYFPFYQLNYVKSRYTATLKKHAMTNAGLVKASDLKSILSEKSGTKIQLELLYLFPWLKSAHITEDLLIDTARKIGCLPCR
ncbi:Hypothetical protein GLP15_582 [Giardia lamblia P15]|uniref:Uncharacterized protein n=1 Tax=Giardia intestinalis (strain P15) TaxID=658858 RepID=E1F551_GIAIA|nr:Hypothetical protein GLP15_582 [Giardia lamblia P15]